MATDFDVVVIGSGFGGAVAACRLAEAGYNVLVLERGRRWQVEDFPREPDDAWIWDHRHPEKHNGWLDTRFFPNMAVVQGAAVGGGSLHYANISIEAKPDLFEDGWPPKVTYGELKPYYDKVGQMLDIREMPTAQWAERTRLMKEAAEKLGYADCFHPLKLAIAFDNDWHYGLPDPHNEQHSKTFVNAFGQEQGTCVQLGYCDAGCPVKAKNTLDLNYIPLAEQHGAEVRSLHMVRSIESVENGGYRVHFDRIEDERLLPGSVDARIVVVAAGSLGSTELLLRCRDEYKTLPNLSPALGHSWSSNGDFLTPATHPGHDVFPSRGVPIASAIDFLGDRHLEDDVHFIIEDGGFPDILGAALGEALEQLSKKRPVRARGATLLQDALSYVLRQRHPLEHTMLWFANGRDAADGTLSLKKKRLRSGKQELYLKWRIKRSEKYFNAVLAMHKQLAEATDGKARPSFTWTIFKDLITPHSLGGCKMGTAPDNGVVNHKGEVFGYKNLYVVDGAIIPKAIGNNPSKTIAALAERVADLMATEDR